MNSSINMKRIYSALSLLLIIFIFIALSLGDTKISIKEIMALLTDKNFMDERNIRAIIFDVRLPSIFMAILIGMFWDSRTDCLPEPSGRSLHNWYICKCNFWCGNCIHT